MIRKDIDIAGGVAYWQLGWTRRDALEQALTALGLGKYTPKLRSNGRVLRHALLEQYASSRTLVRPLKGRAGFVIVREERGADHNTYHHKLMVQVDEHGTITADGPCEELGELQARFFDLASQLSPVVVAKSLVDLITKKIGGTTLKENGGVYWIPEKQLALWDAAADAVEQAAILKGKSVISTLQTVRDEKCIQAVKNAIVHEMSCGVALIEQELAEGTNGEKAWNSRIRQAERMTAKLKQYEDELGVALGELKDQVIKVRGAAAMASIVAGAKAMAGQTDDLAKIGAGIDAARAPATP